MLEGKEVSASIDNGAGEAFIDVNDKGQVEFGVNYSKDLNSLAEIKLSNSVKTDIFKLAEAICAKTETKVDDMFVAGLKQLLGIK